MTARYFALQDFFLCYFHPDWQLDADSRFEVVVDYLNVADPVVIGNVITELRKLVEEPMPDDEFHEMIDRDYWLHYNPARENVTMRAWLQGLLQELENRRETAAESR
jgi:hypothetical protein